jgi:PPOX class probable F420-dependent enzyme
VSCWIDEQHEPRFCQVLLARISSPGHRPISGCRAIIWPTAAEAEARGILQTGPHFSAQQRAIAPFARDLIFPGTGNVIVCNRDYFRTGLGGMQLKMGQTDRQLTDNHEQGTITDPQVTSPCPTRSRKAAFELWHIRKSSTWSTTVLRLIECADTLYVTIDAKPKRSLSAPLKRLKNIAQNPAVAVVVDRYEEDWRQLGWVMLRGHAETLIDRREHDQAQELLRSRYPQLKRMQIAELPGDRRVHCKCHELG